MLPSALGGEVQYDGIVYRRHAGGAPLFDHLSFHCPDNSLVRITAAEGAGLSTLKHLLTRQVSPERGLVRVGGMDVARLDPEVLAHSVIMLDHPEILTCQLLVNGYLLNLALNHRPRDAPTGFKSELLD